MSTSTNTKRGVSSSELKRKAECLRLNPRRKKKIPFSQALLILIELSGGS